jgi:galactitol PTS system EIIA component
MWWREEIVMIQELLIPKMKAESAEEVITCLGQKLQTYGYVKDTYIEAVLQRERELPTGLEMSHINVAIPHTEAVHVKETAIALATLAKPVPFHLMVEPERTALVDIVFLLAVKDPKEQAALLRKMMSVLQNERILLDIQNAEGKQQMLDIVQMSLA